MQLFKGFFMVTTRLIA